MVLDGQSHPAMIAEAFDRFEGHGGHDVGTYQYLEIHHITVGRILHARAGPQRLLDTHTPLLECLKAWPSEQPFELVVCQAIIGDHLSRISSSEGCIETIFDWTIRVESLPVKTSPACLANDRAPKGLGLGHL